MAQSPLPRISVLVNNYNYAAYLPACIDSVLAQDYADFELIVVDDGSKDNSREIIAGYGDRLVAVLKENGGQASSFNAGFAAASGEILCLLDADDAFLPGKLSRLAEIYVRDGVDWCFDKVTTDEAAQAPAQLKLTPVDHRQALGRGRFPSIPVPTSGLTFRRGLLAQILPMPVAQDVVLSDNYLKFAATYLGAGVLVETPLTFQRIHATNRYTGAAQASPLRSRIMIATGLELARRYPGLKALGASLAAGGFAQGELSGRALREQLAAATSAAANPRLAALDLWWRVTMKRARASLAPRKAVKAG
ncbi:glycosyl transferase [Caulobacter vibrioides]|nr:glycosyl transferase [Caulobacter vibrioides]